MFFVVIWIRMRYDRRIMEGVLNIYKPQGMTPLQVIDAVRHRHPEYRDAKMTYAGRLDPMAEGVLIVLVGDAVHEKEAHLALDKTYEADIMLGIGTDTHDLLGMPMAHTIKGVRIERLETEVRNMEGIFEYPFPAYSSKPVNGKPLFRWAREGGLGEIEIPKRTMVIYGVEMIDRYDSTVGLLQGNIAMVIAKVRGDFRQREIIDRWKTVLVGMDNNAALPVVRIRIRCASGTYIRTLAHELGKRLGADAVLVRLIRTRVGDFDIDDAEKITA